MVIPTVVRSALLVLCVVASAVGCTGTQVTGTGGPEPRDAADRTVPAATPPAPRAGLDGMLTVADQKDGDSFVASDGVEYRVGLVNTPERSECGGSEASRRTYELLDEGFLTAPYSTDDHGRSVARVRTAAGDDLGLVLAREGLADDRYLEQFRHEHPEYAEELAPAFAEAREQRAGLWGSCWADEVSVAEPSATPALPDAPSPPHEPDTAPEHAGRVGTWSCHPDYVECLPEGPDLDCRDVGHTVELTGQRDPYRLDGNSTTRTDGVGCDTFDPWSADVTYPYDR